MIEITEAQNWNITEKLRITENKECKLLCSVIVSNDVQIKAFDFEFCILILKLIYKISYHYV